MAERITKRTLGELQRRNPYYRGHEPPLEVNGRTVLLVDDSIATGASISVAIDAIERQHPRRIIVASPLCPMRTRTRLEQRVDTLICLYCPQPFGGVGAWYRNFGETTDEEVRAILDARSRHPSSTAMSNDQP